MSIQHGHTPYYSLQEQHQYFGPEEGDGGEKIEASAYLSALFSRMILVLLG
jgi:hypothetical protein